MICDIIKEINKTYINYRGDEYKVIEYFGKIKKNHYYKVRFTKSGIEKISQISHIHDGHIENIRPRKNYIGSIFGTNTDGQIEVIGIVSDKKYIVKFINTGFIRSADISNILEGKVKDKSIHDNESYIGQSFTSNSGKDNATILSVINDKNVVVTFDGIHTVKLQLGNILKGSFKDPYRPRRFGRCIGVPSIKKYDFELHKLLYQKWSSMIDRCYNPKSYGYMSYGAKGVKVSDDWHCYEYFSEDVQKIPGFDRYKILYGDLELDEDYFQQDKDIKDRIYSKDTCCFISSEMNKSIKMNDAQRLS